MVEVRKQSESNVTPIEKKTPKGLHPIDEMNKLFDQFFHRDWMHPSHWEWPDFSHISSPFGVKMPRMDILDKEGEIQIRAEVPGVEKDDLDITMTSNSVLLKGKTRHEEKEEKENYYRSEISYGVFQRSMMLPVEVDADKAKATFKDGMLELTVPKSDKASRSISIQ